MGSEHLKPRHTLNRDDFAASPICGNSAVYFAFLCPRLMSPAIAKEGNRSPFLWAIQCAQNWKQELKKAPGKKGENHCKYKEILRVNKEKIPPIKIEKLIQITQMPMNAAK